MKSLIVAITLLISVNANAVFLSGHDHVANMREYENAVRIAPNTDYSEAFQFSSYNIGVYDTLYANDEICVPSNKTTKGQVNAIVEK